MQKQILFFLLATSTLLSAQNAGELDLSFGNQGLSVQDQYTFESVTAFAIQTDQKIVAVGFTEEFNRSHITVRRYLPDGTLDLSFAEEGIFLLAPQPRINIANSVALQPDGKIVVAGYCLNQALGNVTDDILVLRLTTNGDLDPTFNDDGIAIFDYQAEERAVDVEISPAGDIYVAGNTFELGHSKMLLYSLNTNGLLNANFGTGGISELQFSDSLWNYTYAMALQPDGKILLAGESPSVSDGAEFGLLRVHPDGQLDASFNNDGIAENGFSDKEDIALTLALSPEGKIILGGYAVDEAGKTHFALMRYTDSGVLDQTFGTNGKVMTPVGDGYGAIAALCLTPDGSIMAVGTAKRNGTYFDFALAKFDASGNLAPNFGAQGLVYTDLDKHYDGVCDAKILPDGKILLGGAAVITENSIAEFVLARYWFQEEVGVGNLVNILSSTWIFPNPTSQSAVHLEYTLLEASTIEIELFSLDGKSLGLLSKTAQSPGRIQETLQLPDGLESGLFVAQIRSKSNQVNVKIMVH